MSDQRDPWMELQGRLLAFEAMLSHLIWQWALSQEHPPSALSKYLRPLEEKSAALARDPGNHPDAMRGMQETIRGMAETLEHTLHAETLRRADAKGPGQA